MVLIMILVGICVGDRFVQMKRCTRFEMQDSRQVGRENFLKHAECVWMILGVKSLQPTRLHSQNPHKTFEMLRKVPASSVAGNEA